MGYGRIRLTKHCIEFIKDAAETLVDDCYPNSYAECMGHPFLKGQLAFVVSWNKGYEVCEADPYIDKKGNGLEVSLRHHSSHKNIAKWYYVTDCWDHWDDNTVFHPNKKYKWNDLTESWDAEPCEVIDCKHGVHFDGSENSIIEAATNVVNQYFKIIEERKKNKIDCFNSI